MHAILTHAIVRLVLRETGVAVCTREHFGSALAHETQRYFRFAYSGINIAEIEEGLAKLKSFMAKFAKKD
jgi:aspartate/methionine/tyrosine aminotransferase